MLEAVLLLLLGIVVILAIIAANGYFVAQEFAYMSVDRVRLGARAKAGDPAARQALKVTQRTSFMLSGAQLGITVTGLLVGYVAEPLVGQALGVLLSGVGIAPAVSISVGTAVTLLVATIVQMIFGELYPKNLAIANAEPMACGLARSTNVYLVIFGWLITFFDWSSNTLLRLVGIQPVHDVETAANARDLERIVADSRDSGDLPAELAMLIDRVLDFPDRDVEHAMIPRAHVGTVDPEATIDEVRAKMAQEHTRYPVVSDSEEPLGVVDMTDLLRSAVPGHTPVTDIMRPPLVVPTLMALPDALGHLVGTRNQLACVIDEYGGFAGILTIEDMAEELVGELTDEHDGTPDVPISAEEDGTWRMDGGVHLDEVQRTVGFGLPEGDYETLAGLLIAEHGALPDEGETIRIPVADDPRDVILDDPVHRAIDVEVLAVSRHVPGELHVRLVETEGISGDPEGAGEPDHTTDAAANGEDHR